MPDRKFIFSFFLTVHSPCKYWFIRINIQSKYQFQQVVPDFIPLSIARQIDVPNIDHRSRPLIFTQLEGISVNKETKRRLFEQECEGTSSGLKNHNGKLNMNFETSCDPHFEINHRRFSPPAPNSSSSWSTELIDIPLLRVFQRINFSHTQNFHANNEILSSNSRNFILFFVDSNLMFILEKRRHHLS